MNEEALELELQIDRARRERRIAVVLVLLLAGAAAFYYVTFAPMMRPDPNPGPIQVKLTFVGWLQATWVGGLIVIAALVNVVRVVQFTRRMRALRTQLDRSHV